MPFLHFIIAGSVIVHQAWDESDSNFPEGHSSTTSLHRSGLELEISVSEELTDDSDTSLLAELASMAVCNGFDYVKVNEPNETISVAMRQCSTQDLRFCHVLLNHYSILDPITCSVVTCTEPSLSNGIYLGDHDGPVYQIEENIHAICQPGYTLVGPITRQCQSNGQWSEKEDSNCELGKILIIFISARKACTCPCKMALPTAIA